MRLHKKRAVGAFLLALSLTAVGIAQVKTQKAGAAAPTAAPMPKTDRMPMAAFKTLLARDEVVTIDVRSSESYAAGHIPGALSIPEESITAATAEKLKRMGKPIATYCS